MLVEPKYLAFRFGDMVIIHPNRSSSNVPWLDSEGLKWMEHGNGEFQPFPIRQVLGVSHPIDIYPTFRWNVWRALIPLSLRCSMYSGQIIIFHQPRFPWNKGISLTKPPFGVRSCEVAIVWPDVWHSPQVSCREYSLHGAFWDYIGALSRGPPSFDAAVVDDYEGKEFFAHFNLGYRKK